MNYLVVDSESNLVVNIVVWDGVTPWSPPDGTIAIQSDIFPIGSTYTPDQNNVGA